MTRYAFRAGLAMAGATALALAACDDGRRQIAAPQPASLAELSAISDLPPAEPAPVNYAAADQGYQWAERAYGLQRAVYDAPPDYEFAYEDVEPYAWETEDDWALYAEPSGVDYRYYYYEPGAAQPYFVRDHEYGYAFGPAGALVAVFYADGRYVPADAAQRLAPTAGRYWARGRGLRAAGWSAPRTRVDERIWIERAPAVTRSADPWLRAARGDRDWRQWRTRDDDRELRRFAQETRRREGEGKAWRERVARLPPPQPGETRQDDRRELRRLEAADAGRQRQAEDRARADQRRAQIDQQRQARDAAAAERRTAQADAQRQRQTAERQQVQAQRRAQAEQQRQARADQQRTQADQRRQAEQAQQRQVAEQRRAQADQQRQAQAAQREQAQAARRQQAEQQRQQAQAERRQARQETRQPPQARTPSAAERGQPAADRAPRGKGHDKRD